MAIALEAASAAGTFKSPLLLPKSSMSLTSLALENRRRVDIFSPSRLTKINLVRNSRHFNSARSAAISASTVFSKKCEKPIIVIDNYDSFTYNLCQAVLRFGDISSTSKDCGVLMVSNPCSLSLYLGELGCKFEVYRNDELTVEELKGKHPRGVLISPGPGAPQDSGISLQTVLELGPIVPLFGVCMGLQCIGEAFGGKIVRSPYGVVHGKSSPVYYDEKGEGGLFTGLSNPFLAGRYHSLVIEKESFPSEELEITAWTEDGLIMGARHKIYKHLQGVQFHPESIITTEGKTIVCNFVKLIERLEAAEVEEN